MCSQWVRLAHSHLRQLRRHRGDGSPWIV